MDVGADELAGVVDLFGALTRGELERALAELAFKREGEFDPDEFGDTIDAALDSYHLVTVDDEAVSSVDGSDSEWVVVGPVAYPELPDDAADLPHIMDASEREVDRPAAGRAAERRFRADAAAAVEAKDDVRIAELLDVSYELEAWAPVDLDAARSRLDTASQ